MKYGIDLSTMKMVRLPAKKKRVWFYKWGKKGRKQQIEKEGKWWYYNSKDGCSIGCDTLEGAKGDLIYGKAIVWSELIKVN